MNTYHLRAKRRATDSWEAFDIRASNLQEAIDQVAFDFSSPGYRRCDVEINPQEPLDGSPGEAADLREAQEEIAELTKDLKAAIESSGELSNNLFRESVGRRLQESHNAHLLVEIEEARAQRDKAEAIKNSAIEQARERKRSELEAQSLAEHNTMLAESSQRIALELAEQASDALARASWWQLVAAQPAGAQLSRAWSTFEIEEY